MFWQFGYPKSGNTAVCEIISHLIGQHLFNHNEIMKLPESKRPLWGRGHLTAAEACAGLPIDGVIYCVRHPLDVALSAFRHRMIYDWDDLVDPDVETPLRNLIRGIYIDSFIGNGGDIGYAEGTSVIGAGTWLENVSGWMDLKSPAFPVCIIRYRELMESPIQTMISAMKLVTGLEYSTKHMQAACDFASPQNAKNRRGDRFLGDARTGGWRTVLSVDQEFRGLKMFGQKCLDLGILEGQIEV